MYSRGSTSLSASAYFAAGIGSAEVQGHDWVPRCSRPVETSQKLRPSEGLRPVQGDSRRTGAESGRLNAYLREAQPASGDRGACRFGSSNVSAGKGTTSGPAVTTVSCGPGRCGFFREPNGQSLIGGGLLQGRIDSQFTTQASQVLRDTPPVPRQTFFPIWRQIRPFHPYSPANCRSGPPASFEPVRCLGCGGRGSPEGPPPAVRSGSCVLRRGQGSSQKL